MYTSTYYQRFLTPAERFWMKVEKTATCWLWHGSTQKLGYGTFHKELKGGKPRLVLAHRFSYELHKGLIPDGLTIDHLCRVRNCVRPDHLEAVSLAENRRRGTAGAVTAARQLNKTHCPQGHIYDEANTYRDPKYGTRHCRICRRESNRSHQGQYRSSHIS